MANTTRVEYPKDTEKLSYRFILDSLKEEMLGQNGREDSPGEIVSTIVDLDSKKHPTTQTCGMEAEAESLALFHPEELSIKPEEINRLELPLGKKYFRIGDVSELIGVEPYVLRYWESEFPNVKPLKSGSGHRVYSRKDVESLHVIRHLLHVEKFSLKGAKKRLLELKKQTKETAQKEAPNQKLMKTLVHELKELIGLAKAGI